ncbi:MAG: J domain-containing protein [bacterium]|nr:J domain-containing protein [bacterium]MCP5071013.1 J domain-containing protein [bacterium]
MKTSVVDLEVDPALDLDPKIQQELIEFANGLDRPYHELLGVASEADSRAIKKAYFQKAKRFHPDRYFRKNVGEFLPMLDTCFKKLLEAYELLSDPATREEVQRGEKARAAKAARGRAGEASTTPSPEPTKPRISGTEAARRLRRRMSGLQGHHKAKQERRQKAKTFFESGMAAFRSDRWLEAAGSVRLAMAFDPANEVYREEFAKVQCKAHEERAKQLTRSAEAALDLRNYQDGFEALEEACHYRPFDADLAIRAAKIAWQAIGDLRKAKDLASSACELEPERAEYHRILGQIYKAADLTANAKRELEAAIRLDPKDKEAKAELRAL